MNKLLKIIKEKLRKKSFWLRESNALLIEKEKDKKGWKSESALMNHIVSKWFKN